MYIKIHNFILILICLLCSGCYIKKPKKPADHFSEITSEQAKVQNHFIKKNKKLSISKLWLKKCSVSFSENDDASVLLKGIANSLGLQISFNQPVKLNYKAKRKKFIDILLDICNVLNLKISISEVNAIIDDDTPYFHTYNIGSLPSNIATEFSTSASHAFGEENKLNISKSSYKTENHFYENILKNLASLLNKTSTFSINEQAGVLGVFATQKDHLKVLMYLNSIKQGLNDQILVEAKILEVELYEDFVCGIDFDGFKNTLFQNANFRVESGGVNSENMLSFFSNVSHAVLHKSLLQYLSSFGKISSVSNPYMLISNNHVGIFKAVENKIYFKFKNETVFHSDNKFGTQNRQAEFITCPVGVTFSVHVVKLQNGLIKLYLKPSITEVSKEVADAGYQYVSNGDKHPVASIDAPKVPIIKTREMETVLILHDGEYAIIGGLIDQSSNKERKVLYRSLKSKKTELIIFLKVSLVDNNENIDEYEFLVTR